MPALEVLSLDEATPRIRAPGSGDTYTMPRSLAVTGEALTGSSATSTLALTQTWNTTGTPTAFQLNVTDTASNANSLLMDLRLGGNSMFAVTKTSTEARGSFILRVSGSTDRVGILNSTGMVVRQTGVLGWGASTDAGGAPTLALAYDANNTLAQRNGTNAQAFRVYNTFTDASNYERGFMRWSSNNFEVGTQSAGTGAARDVFLQRNGDTFLSSTAASPFNVPVNASFAGDITMAAADPFTFSGRSRISSPANGVIRITANTAANGAAHELLEMAAPAAPATNGVRIYAEDNGAGKTRLMALFATGAAQQIAIEP